MSENATKLHEKNIKQLRNNLQIRYFDAPDYHMSVNQAIDLFVP